MTELLYVLLKGFTGGEETFQGYALRKLPAKIFFLALLLENLEEKELKGFSSLKQASENCYDSPRATSKSNVFKSCLPPFGGL